jgi:hypothetical protein
VTVPGIAGDETAPAWFRPLSRYGNILLDTGGGHASLACFLLPVSAIRLLVHFDVLS